MKPDVENVVLKLLLPFLKTESPLTGEIRIWTLHVNVYTAAGMHIYIWWGQI
jgi:hypothetical protein